MDAVTTGDFVVGRVLGEGRFATVFHARLKAANHKKKAAASGQQQAQEENHPSVAIKVIEKATLNRNESLLWAVLQEQRLLRRLAEGRFPPLGSPPMTAGESAQSGNETAQGSRFPSFVVPLLASFHDDQFVYMVMECARGTVGDAIREHVSTEATHNAPNSPSVLSRRWLRIAAGLSYQTVQALEYIHTRSVIHCDVKPDNLLLSVGGRVQLCDFGSAIDVQGQSPATDNRGTGTYRAGRASTSPRGTADYASPELLRGLGCVSFETDLWSLGCVMFALLRGGTSPFHALSDSLAVEKVMSFDSAAAKLVLKPLPPDWREAVCGFLESQPSRRWGKPREPAAASRQRTDGAATEGRHHASSLHERYGYLKQLPLWAGMGVAEPLPGDLLSSPEWSSERFEDMRDGNLGWTAFA